MNDAEEIATITDQLNDDQSITLAQDQRAIELEPKIVGPDQHTLSVDVLYNARLRLTTVLILLEPVTCEADFSPSILTIAPRVMIPEAQHAS